MSNDGFRICCLISIEVLWLHFENFRHLVKNVIGIIFSRVLRIDVETLKDFFIGHFCEHFGASSEYFLLQVILPFFSDVRIKNFLRLKIEIFLQADLECFEAVVLFYLLVLCRLDNFVLLPLDALVATNFVDQLMTPVLEVVGDFFFLEIVFHSLIDYKISGFH